MINELREKNIQPTGDPENGGSYSFSETVGVNVHFETYDSLKAKMDLYNQQPIQGVAFWRISQGAAGFWNAISK